MFSKEVISEIQHHFMSDVVYRRNTLGETSVQASRQVAYTLACTLMTEMYEITVEPNKRVGIMEAVLALQGLRQLERDLGDLSKNLTSFIWLGEQFAQATIREIEEAEEQAPTDQHAEIRERFLKSVTDTIKHRVLCEME